MPRLRVDSGRRAMKMTRLKYKRPSQRYAPTSDFGIRGVQKLGADKTEPTVPRKRTRSASASKRIAEAQRKRWSALKRVKTEGEEPKRKLSAAGRKAIIEASKKRWQAFHKGANAQKRAS